MGHDRVQAWHADAPAARSTQHDSEEAGDGAWSTGLFMSLLLQPIHAALACACFCGCGSSYTFAKTRNMVDESSRGCTEGCVFCMAWLTGVACMMGYANRVRLRASYGIRGSEWGDFLAHCCCQPCSLIQEYRHVKDRGVPLPSSTTFSGPCTVDQML
jgi:Cys-rich protein (TIGR01571 family)